MPLRPTHSYYVCMIDYGKRGLEAVVRPEDTRQNIIDQLMDLERSDVAFIHLVDGLYMEDVTNDLFCAAEVQKHYGYRDIQAAE